MSQQDRQEDSDPSYTTVESQVEYEPQHIGNAVLEAGEPEQVFREYALEKVPVLLDGEDTGRRLIRRNGQYLADVSTRYHLVPNEHVVKAANQVAKELGAVPFHDFSGDWFIKLDDHVFQDKAGRRVHALYAWDDPVAIAPDDEIQMGFAVHNSIDGSLSFQMGLFTFRHACQNMVTMGMNNQGMSFDDREVVQYDSRRHTSGLDVEVEQLAQEIEEMMLVTDDISDTYRSWRDQFVTVDDVLGLIDRLPSKDLPDWMDNRDVPVSDREQTSIAESLDQARENESLDGEDRLTQERAESIARDGLHGTETRWGVYNDITESVWHDRASSDLTKDRKFTKLHRVMEPADGVR